MVTKETQKQRALFPPFLIHNLKILQYYKDISCLAFGFACGILQLQSTIGLLFFIITSLISSLLFHYAMITFNVPRKGFTLSDFYVNPIKDVYIGNVGRQIATFTMMWCLIGALVT